MPEWLPEPLNVNPWTEHTYDMLYRVFCRDIRDTALFYEEKRIWIFPDIEDERETIFWHLTTREEKAHRIPRRKQRHYKPEQSHDPETKVRYPDMRRCEKLNWIKPLIEHSYEHEVLAWDYEEGDGSVKTYIWIKDCDFVVIMKKYPSGQRRLLTSYHVDKEYTKADFLRKYENRIK